MTSTARTPPRKIFAALALLAVASLLGGCDNPGCVFSGSCGSGGGALGGNNPAFRPVDDNWVTTGAPAQTGFFPSTTVNTETPIVVTFNESMAAPTVITNIKLFELDGMFGEQPVLLNPPVFVGDGRVLVLTPAVPLTADHEYQVRWQEGAFVSDTTGTPLALPPDNLVGSFTVETNDPTLPRVLTTWPRNLSQNQSTTSEIVVVFDRPMNRATVTNQSFVVTADGVEPAFNPPPQPALLLGAGAFPTTDTRIWQYRSVDGSGNSVSLGLLAAVNVALSPPGNKIMSESMLALPESEFDFDTASFEAPSSAEIVSMPTDAIGIDNLGPSPTLDIAVTMEDPSADKIGMFLFGNSKANPGQVQAVFREVAGSAIAYNAATKVATLGEAELQLTTSSSPVTTVFADGDLTIGLRIERGGQFSALRLVDVDMDTAGAQDPLLDVTRPTFTAFGTSGNEVALFSSELRDLSVVGRADEPIRAALVTAAGTTNNGPIGSPAPPVVGSNENGLFVAAPVDLGGIVDPPGPVPFMLDLYDRALNAASVPTAGTYNQFGAVGPTPSGPTIDITVYDAQTFAPVGGAGVFTHDDVGGVITPVGMAVTLSDGFAMVNAGVGEPILTVDAAGYDLFTYHGLPAGVMTVPLHRTSSSPATLSGTVSSTETTAFPLLDRYVRDSLSPTSQAQATKVGGCSPNFPTFSVDCSYGNVAVRAGPARNVSFVAVSVPASEAAYNAAGFFLAHFLELPLAPPSPGVATSFNFRVDSLLNGVGVPSEEKAIDGPRTTLNASGVSGIDLTSLVGVPEVAVLSQIQSMHGTALVGLGAALDPSGSPNDMWRIVSAIPGVAEPTTGALRTDGVVVPGSMVLSVELRDTLGNRAGRRPDYASVPGTLVPLDVPVVSSPPPGGNTGPAGYDLDFADVLGSAGVGGIYRATLVGANGRGWQLYRRSGGGGTRTIRVVDLVGAGGVALPDGPVFATVEAWGWPGFDETRLILTDIERVHDHFAQSGAIQYMQP